MLYPHYKTQHSQFRQMKTLFLSQILRLAFSCCIAIDSLSHTSEETKKGIFICSVKDSVILLREITGSVYVKDVSNSIISVNCQQIRIHNTTNSLFCLQIPNHPVIEDSNGVLFSENVFIWSLETESSAENVFTLDQCYVESICRCAGL